MAVCVGPALLRNGETAIDRRNNGRIDNFIGLAPAFSLARFTEADKIFYQNIYYRDYCPTVERMVFTASIYDNAFAPVFWSDSAGDHEKMEEFCALEQSVSVACIAATADGGINGYDASAKLNYIDTSELMKYTMPGTEGGGHSDIYRPEIGKLVWTLINRPTER